MHLAACVSGAVACMTCFWTVLDVLYPPPIMDACPPPPPFLDGPSSVRAWAPLPAQASQARGQPGDSNGMAGTRTQTVPIFWVFVLDPPNQRSGLAELKALNCPQREGLKWSPWPPKTSPAVCSALAQVTT